MNRNASLVTAALHLRRQAYVALPWGYRLANLMTVLSSHHTDDFGRVLFGVFLMAGVQGMDDTGRPLPTNVNEIDRKVPRGYGREFGARAYKVALKVLRDDSLAEDALSVTMIKLLSKAKDGTLASVIGGRPLKDAENFAFKMIRNNGIDLLRKRKQEGPAAIGPEGEDLSQTIEDPGSWDDLGEIIPERKLKQIEEDLSKGVDKRLFPDLPLYFRLLIEGWTDSEILSEGALPFLKDHPEMSQANWSKTYKSKVKDVLRKHLPELVAN